MVQAEAYYSEMALLIQGARRRGWEDDLTQDVWGISEDESKIFGCNYFYPSIPSIQRRK